MLLQIVTVSAHLQFPLVYKALYLLAFLSFLRISNILPHAARNFDKTRHLCVGDVVFAFQRAVIVVKSSKTLQDRVKTTTIDIPYLGASALCPIAALKQMLATYPSHQDSSLFQIPQAGSLIPLTDSAARKHLKQMSSLLGLHRSLTFHDFRRGASWAFQHGVSIQDIQAQGTWTSNCVWRYIALPSCQSQVSASFRSHLYV